MQRFTISIDDHLAEDFDRLIAERGYDNRSEAVRDLLRSHLDRQRETAEAVLSGQQVLEIGGRLRIEGARGKEGG